jgi:hypothetical protein
MDLLSISKRSCISLPFAKKREQAQKIESNRDAIGLVIVTRSLLAALPSAFFPSVARSPSLPRTTACLPRPSFSIPTKSPPRIHVQSSPLKVLVFTSTRCRIKAHGLHECRVQFDSFRGQQWPSCAGQQNSRLGGRRSLRKGSGAMSKGGAIERSI